MKLLSTLLTTATFLALAGSNLLAQRTGDISDSRHLRVLADAPGYDALFESAMGAPDWSNGWGIRIEGDPLTATHFMTVSPDGQLRNSVASWQDATEFMLKHAAVFPDGTVVVTGHALMHDRSARYFIARLSKDGSVARSITTGPFAPLCICASPDGTVWALGSELNKEELNQNYAILRHFDFDNGLLGEAIESKGFTPTTNPDRVINVWYVGSTYSSWLRCNREQAYVYSNLTNEIIDVDATTHQETRWKIEAGASEQKVIGLALTLSGDLFANLASPRDKRSVGSQAIFALERDERQKTARWVQVSSDSDATASANDKAKGPFGLRLLGNDGDRLLLEHHNGSEKAQRRSWYDVSKTSRSEVRNQR